MKRTLSIAALGLSTLAAAPAFAQEDTSCGEVSITEMNWASGSVVTGVATFLMQQGYGCDVTVVPSSTNPAITSVAESGEPDILTELWVNAAPVYDRLEAEGKVEALTGVLSDGGVEGWWIPDYLLEAHPELATIEGVLENPELVGNRFHNCPDGWACKTVNNNNIRAAGLEEAGIEVFNHGSGETMATSIASAYENEEPWFGYYWAPTSVLGRYPMTRVDVGGYDEEAHDCNSTEDCADPQLSAYPNGKVLTVVTESFAEDEPEVVDMLRNLQFTNDQMNSILAWQQENSATAEEAAVHFLQNYKDTWSSWLNDSARERLSSML
ncbi:glycine betaine/proline ABC transporter, periplasmic glycine betaine/proline-binding protein [Roseivivax marinus]|uniref:Glycine betaine/proline ABC transporter, periplasmic glycine betaine/proline-binding protein n=1 Tax=Roseivivax marinus TaxID=1379903 RepID=W4HP50_9RHOB|nr:ABC transporter substrate-binding protein [Roseivivax marinus]ETW13785.1 glycine betaine/proline ABC transporter, periplasmic glycine betaine/proline-binding protein [Roseivivax marinus]